MEDDLKAEQDDADARHKHQGKAQKLGIACSSLFFVHFRAYVT